MRRTILVVAIFSVGLLARGMWDGPAVQAEQGGRGADVPIGNGDVNGDGTIDVSDGIWIINHVFRGGPEPVPIECPPAGLPSTGQALCHDRDGNEIPCDSVDYPGQDGFYQAGCPTEGRFIDNEDATVTDTCTGLMWQKRTAPGTYTWQAALNYCESLDLAGHSDWRLPNVRELQSIANYGRLAPAIDPSFEALSDWYWSSSSYSFYPPSAWVVSFDVSSVSGSGAKGSVRYVRAVRGGL